VVRRKARKKIKMCPFTLCSGILWNGVSAFLVAYINDVKRAPLILAGGLAAISYTVGSLAQILGGEIYCSLSLLLRVLFL